MRHLAMLACATALAGCGEGTDPGPPRPDVASLALVAGDTVLSPLERGSYAAVARDSLGTALPAPITWGTSDPSVAVIDSTGTLEARAEGITWVTAQAGERRDSVALRVTRSWVALFGSDGDSNCGLRPDSTAACWTIPGTTPPAVPTLRAIDPALRWRQLDLGDLTTCGVTPGGSLLCWAPNGLNELGFPPGADPTVPTVMGNGLTFASVENGLHHQCAVTIAGGGYCWGLNDHGEVGDSTLTPRTTPTPVAGAQVWMQIATGGYDSCGLTPVGAPWCWGFNPLGYLGVDSSLPNVRAPLPVAGGPYARLDMGRWHRCALTPAGGVECWGLNWDGQLGTGTVDSVTHPVPAPIAMPGPFVALATGALFSCATAAAGPTYCWGRGAPGGAANPVPTALTSRPFVALAAADHHVCGLTAGGGAYCVRFDQGGPVTWRVPDP